MIKLDNISVMNFENAIRGMRNPMKSWDKSDSGFEFIEDPCIINPNDEVRFIMGEKDMKLAQKLVKAGSDERKFLRQIFVSVDITAPLYWWKEADQYRVSCTTNSTSTMHSISKKQLTLDDFSTECLTEYSKDILFDYIQHINTHIQNYNLWKEKNDWWQIIQLLPSSYNQVRTWTANYEVLRNIYHARKNHKLDEWREFCRWIETLPYAKEFITD